MPTRSDEVQSGEWAARSDKPGRSVFGNYNAEARNPLTPALSPSKGERENPSQSSREPETGVCTSDFEISMGRPKLFPLPLGGGEGQGEGAAAAEYHPNLQLSIDLTLARAFLYRYLAQAYQDPTPESWNWLCSSETQDSLLAATEDSFLSANVAAFGHAARGRCPLNEIEYGDLKADPLFQPHRLADLAAFYRAFGLEITEDADERHDHLCLELEFMTVLAAKEAYALEHQLDTEALSVCRDAQKKFLREHLGRWTPAFTRRLAAATDHPTLTALAIFTRAFVETECARFGVSPVSEDLLLRPVNEAEESVCASCGLMQLPPGAAVPAAAI